MIKSEFELGAFRWVRILEAEGKRGREREFSAGKATENPSRANKSDYRQIWV